MCPRTSKVQERTPPQLPLLDVSVDVSFLVSSLLNWPRPPTSSELVVLVCSTDSTRLCAQPLCDAAVAVRSIPKSNALRRGLLTLRCMSNPPLVRSGCATAVALQQPESGASVLKSMTSISTRSSSTFSREWRKPDERCTKRPAYRQRSVSSAPPLTATTITWGRTRNQRSSRGKEKVMNSKWATKAVLLVYGAVAIGLLQRYWLALTQ